jgi:hypothetical protein
MRAFWSSRTGWGASFGCFGSVLFAIGALVVVGVVAYLAVWALLVGAAIVVVRSIVTMVRGIIRHHHKVTIAHPKVGP